MDVFVLSFVQMSQNSINSVVASRICCENLSRNFKLSVFATESHRGILSRLCVSLRLLPQPASPRHLSTSARHTQFHNKGLQRVQTPSVTQEEIDSDRGTFISPVLSPKLRWTPLICRKMRVVIQTSFVTVLRVSIETCAPRTRCT